ncbi:hypothetical protein D3C81_1507240 [compost metagenome]
MFGYMVAQARHDQHGCGGLQFFHVRALALVNSVDCRLLEARVKSRPASRFTLRVTNFSVDDTAAVPPGPGLRCSEMALHLTTQPL